MRFLNVSANTELRRERGFYLKALGFQVVNARDVWAATTAFELGYDVDIAILCHTLPVDDKLAFSSLLRRMGAKTLIVELVLAEPPVTPGLALEADREFQPVMMSWADSLAS